MPSDVSLRAMLVWYLVGFFVGAGWTAGSWVAARLLTLM